MRNILQLKAVKTDPEKQLSVAKSKENVGTDVHNAIIEAGDTEAVTELLRNPKQKLSQDSLDKCAQHKNPYVRIALAMSDYDLSVSQMQDMLNAEHINDEVKHPETTKTSSKKEHLDEIGFALSFQKPIRGNKEGKTQSRELPPEIIDNLWDLKSDDIYKNIVNSEHAMDYSMTDKIVQSLSKTRTVLEKTTKNTKPFQLLNAVLLDLAKNEKQPLSDTAFKTLWEEGDNDVKVALAGCVRNYSEIQMKKMEEVAKDNKAVEGALQKREATKPSEA